MLSCVIVPARDVGTGPYALFSNLTQIFLHTPLQHVRMIYLQLSDKL